MENLQVEDLQEQINDLQERCNGYQPMINALHEAKDRVYQKLSELKRQLYSQKRAELMKSIGLNLNERYEVDSATYTHITIIGYREQHDRDGNPISILFNITGKSRETNRWRNDKNLWTPEQLKGIILL